MERQVMRARLVRIDGGGMAWVEVPELGLGQEFGPLEVFDGAVAGDQLLVASLDGVQDDIAIVGKRGGESGGSGPGGPGAFYEQAFVVPSTLWTVTHDLGRLRPEVVLTDASGNEFFGDVTYDSPTSLHVDFTFPTSGTVTVSL